MIAPIYINQFTLRCDLEGTVPAFGLPLGGAFTTPLDEEVGAPRGIVPLGPVVGPIVVLNPPDDPLIPPLEQVLFNMSDSHESYATCRAVRYPVIENEPAVLTSQIQIMRLIGREVGREE